jgi:hypothetical protein
MSAYVLRGTPCTRCHKPVDRAGAYCCVCLEGSRRWNAILRARRGPRVPVGTMLCCGWWVAGPTVLPWPCLSCGREVA